MRPLPLQPGGEDWAGCEGKAGGEGDHVSLKFSHGTILCTDLSPVKAGEGSTREPSQRLQNSSWDCSCEG